MKDDQDSYICGECGNTSPVPNEECSNCGGKMMPAGADFETPHSDDEAATDDFGGPKVVSLEEEGEKEARDDYDYGDE